jgi:hypothetical protein
MTLETSFSTKSFFLAGVPFHGVLNKDPMIRLDGARPPLIKSKYEFYKVIIYKISKRRHIGLQKIHLNKIRVLVAGTNKAGRLTRQAG